MPDRVDDFIALPREKQLSILQRMSPDMQTQLFGEIKKRRSGPRTITNAPPAEQTFQTPENRTFWNYASEIGGGLGRGLANVPMGVWQAVTSPRKTGEAIAGQIVDVAVPAAQQQFKETQGAPLIERVVGAGLTGLENAPIIGPSVEKMETGYFTPEAMGAASELGTTAATAELGGRAALKGYRSLKGMREGMLRSATKTGPQVARDVVERTKTANEKIAEQNRLAGEEATRKNVERAKEHKEDVQEALHETEGREIAREQAVKGKAEEIRSEEAGEAAGLRAKQAKAEQSVAAANEKARLKAEKDFAAAQQEHFKKSAADKQLTEAHEQATRQQQEAQARLNQVDQQSKVDMRKVEQRVHADADKLYEDLKPKLNKFEADPVTTASIVDDAVDLIQPATGKPPLLDKMEKSLQSKVFTYGDLDNFRSAIGKALSKGGLSGDFFHIYETMQDSIIDEMSKIADERGLTDEANAARSAWRNWAEAFRDRKSPFRKVLDSPEQHGTLSKVRGKQSYLAKLRAFGPDGAALADQLEGALNAAQASKAAYSAYGGVKVPAPKAPSLEATEPPQPATPKQVPASPKPPLRLTSGSPEERAAQQVKQTERAPIPDRPETAVAETKPKQVVTPESLSAEKAETARASARSLSKESGHLYTIFSVLDAIRKLTPGKHFSPYGAAADIAGRVAYSVGKNTWAEYLQRPEVINAVSKLTVRDAQEIMKLPEDQRAGFEEFLRQAQAQGMPIPAKVLSLIVKKGTPLAAYYGLAGKRKLDETRAQQLQPAQ